MGSSLSSTGAESVKQLGVGSIYVVNDALVKQAWQTFESALAPLDRARMPSFLTRLCREAGMTHTEIARLLEDLVDVDLLTRLCQDADGKIVYDRFACILRVYFGPEYDEPIINRGRKPSDKQDSRSSHGRQLSDSKNSAASDGTQSSPVITRFLYKNSDKGGVARKRSSSLFSKKFWGNKPTDRPPADFEEEIDKIYIPEALSLERAHYWEPLVRFICTRETSALDVLVCVGDTAQSAVITRLVVRVLDSRSLLLVQLHRAIKSEVDKNTNPATLFRENNFATKAMVYLARTLCHAQFAELRPVLSRLAKLKQSLDINEWKSSKLEGPQEAVQRLESFVAQVLDVIVKNPSPTHPAIKHVAYYLLREVEQKYKGASTELIGVSSFVFLRAWCPIVTTPDAFGIYMEPIDATMRKNLVLMSRILQHIANGVFFSKNVNSSTVEGPLAALNPFIERSMGALQSFLYSFSAVPSYTNVSIPVLPMSVVDEEIMEGLHGFIREQNEMILKGLIEKEEIDTSKDMQRVLRILSGEMVDDAKENKDEKEALERKKDSEGKTMPITREEQDGTGTLRTSEGTSKRRQRPKTYHPSQATPRSSKKHRRRSTRGADRSHRGTPSKKVSSKKDGNGGKTMDGIEVNALSRLSEIELDELSALLDIADKLRGGGVSNGEREKVGAIEAKQTLRMIRKRTKELELVQERLKELVERAREEVPLIVKSSDVLRNTLKETARSMMAVKVREETLQVTNAIVRALSDREKHVKLNIGLLSAATSPRDSPRPPSLARLTLSELSDAISRQQMELTIEKVELEERTDQYERVKAEYSRSKDRVDVLLDRLADLDPLSLNNSAPLVSPITSPSKSRRSLFSKSGGSSSRKSSATKVQLATATPRDSDEIMSQQSQRPRFVKQSLEEHLESEKGRESFREFCTESYCEENLDFYFKTQDLLDMKGEVLKSACEALFDEYVQHGAVKQVNLDDNVMKQIAVDIKNDMANVDTFAQAALDAYSLLAKDVWPRYKNSSRYKECMEHILQEEKRFPLTAQATLLRDAAKLVKEEAVRVRAERDLLEKERELLKADYWRLESARHAFAQEQARARLKGKK